MNLADRDGVIWLDGELVPWREAKVHVLTHTLHYGVGIFEGIRSYEVGQGIAILHLDEHVERFFNSAKILNITIPFSQATISEAIITAVKENKLAAAAAYIRPLLFLGSEEWGVSFRELSVHVAIAVLKWVGYRKGSNLEKGVRVKISSFQRNNINSVLTKAKISGLYVNCMLAIQEAQSAGCDDTLMLDQLGFVTEASGANFFMVKNGVVYTPNRDTIFEGITRTTIIEFCRHLSIPLLECNITRDQVYLADEAFFTGTAYGIVPVVELDKRMIGKGACGAITQKLRDLYQKMVQGQIPEYKKWLTYVRSD